jgi:hypothetical protein
MIKVFKVDNERKIRIMLMSNKSAVEVAIEILVWTKKLHYIYLKHTHKTNAKIHVHQMTIKVCLHYIYNTVNIEI